MQQIARSRGGRCISKVYININTHLLQKCAKGHVWKAIPYSIKKGSQCPVCSSRKKLTIGEMQKIVLERKGKCLSLKYINSRTKLIWMCELGHIWIAIPSPVKRGSWCPAYSKRPKPTKYNIQDMQEMARKKGGKCVSKILESVEKKLIWQCVVGHKWEATPTSIRRGLWYPDCYSMNRGKIKSIKH